MDATFGEIGFAEFLFNYTPFIVGTIVLNIPRFSEIVHTLFALPHTK